MTAPQQDWQFVRSLFWPSLSEKKFVALVVKNGFADVPDYLETLMQMPQITPAFKAWRKSDNTKAGLLKIIQAGAKQ